MGRFVWGAMPISMLFLHNILAFQASPQSEVIIEFEKEANYPLWVSVSCMELENTILILYKTACNCF